MHPLMDQLPPAPTFNAADVNRGPSWGARWVLAYFGSGIAVAVLDQLAPSWLRWLIPVCAAVTIISASA